MQSGLTRRFEFSVCIVLVLAALVVAMVGSRNNLIPNSDEIYHLLAARSFVGAGDFQVGTGSYERAPLYTGYVALGYKLFGQSLTAAKLVTAATFALLIGGVFISLNRRVGLSVALMSAIFLMFAPHSLEIATTVRFYMPQALFFWIGAWSLYRAVDGTSRNMIYGLIGTLSLIVAYKLQPATLIGVAAIAVWAMIVLIEWTIRKGIKGKQLLWVSVVCLGIIVVAFFVVPIDSLWDSYRSAAAWNEGSSARYYYWVMTEHYNPFWALFPLMGLLAWYRQPRLGGFAVVVFSICFVLHSFGGMKEDRYIYYAFPFFFVAVSMGVSVVHDFLLKSDSVLSQRLPFLTVGRSRALASVLSAGALSFIVISNLGYVNSAKALVSGFTKREQPRWDLLAAEYGAELRNASVLLTNSPNHSLYVLDRNPIGIGFSRLMSGTKDHSEFSQDRRTGGVLISKATSLGRVIDCFRDGYLVAEERQWLSNPRSGITEEMVPIIDDRMDRLDVPDDWKINLFKWSRLPGSNEDVNGADCTSLEKYVT